MGKGKRRTLHQKRGKTLQMAAEKNEDLRGGGGIKREKEKGGKLNKKRGKKTKCIFFGYKLQK